MRDANAAARYGGYDHAPDDAVEAVNTE